MIVLFEINSCWSLGDAPIDSGIDEIELLFTNKIVIGKGESNQKQIKKKKNEIVIVVVDSGYLEIQRD